jgi:hypothetical protein
MKSSNYPGDETKYYMFFCVLIAKVLIKVGPGDGEGKGS